MKKLFIVLVVIVVILAANIVRLVIRYNDAITSSQYWYQMYENEKNSTEDSIESISKIIFDSYHHGTVTDNGVSIWFENQYGEAVYLNDGNAIAVYK